MVTTHCPARPTRPCRLKVASAEMPPSTFSRKLTVVKGDVRHGCSSAVLLLLLFDGRGMERAKMTAIDQVSFGRERASSRQ